MRPKKYYLAKVNISENIFSSFENRQRIINEYIPNAILNNSTIIEYDKYNFRITDTKEFIHENEKYISGNLTRSTKMRVTILEGNQTREKTFEEVKAIPVEFFYNVTKEVVAYRTCTEINSEKFIQNFIKVIESDTRVGDIKLIPYTSVNKIRDFFKELDVVTKINFHLIKPNNPGSKEYYDFERIINDNNLKELDINMANGNGIKYRKEGSNEFTNSIESGISLTESAYGTVEVKGYIESEVPGKRKDKKKIKKYKSATSGNFPRFVKTNGAEKSNIISKIHSEIIRLFL